MEKLSRMKKYEELRNSIETDNHVDTVKDMTSLNGDTLKKFDSAVLKRVKISEEHSPEREKVMKPVSPSLKDDVTFTNEYMDDFIQEVREYNIKKGNKESVSTQIDILNQLNAVSDTKRAKYVEPIPKEKPIKEKKSILSKDAIALEVAHLLQEDDLEDEITEYEEDTKNISPAQEEIDGTINDGQIEETSSIPFQGKKENVEHKKKKNEHSKKVYEETKQLREQLDGYEDELTDLSDGVEKTNKMLNFVICFLVLVLLIIIGFIIYSLLKAGGKIS